jgi:hypothetical protein
MHSVLDGQEPDHTGMQTPTVGLVGINGRQQNQRQLTRPSGVTSSRDRPAGRRQFWLPAALGEAPPPSCGARMLDSGVV